MNPTLVLIVACVALLVLAAFVRSAPGPAVVVRHGRVVRPTRAPFTVLVPFLDRLEPWPHPSHDLGLQVRGTLADGTAVRGLVGVTVKIEPAQVGAPHHDPVRVVTERLYADLSGSITGGSIADLGERAEGLSRQLVGHEITGSDGRLVGVVADATVVEVDLLLAEQADGLGGDA